MAVSAYHQRIMKLGLEEAQRQAKDSQALREVNSAYEVLTDTSGKINFVHAGFAMSSIPHRATEDVLWERESGAGSKLRLEAGLDHEGVNVGLPYGLMARYILLYLQTYATRTRSREIQLGESMYDWLRTMDITPGGKTYQIIREQSKRISLCRLDFFFADSDVVGHRRGGFVRDAILPISERGSEAALWREVVLLDEVFYETLLRHSLPLSEAGVRACGPSSVSLDIYIWLAYRLHHISKPTEVSWAALKAQFGQHYSKASTFKSEFQRPLTNALRAYPEAKVELGPRGVTLYPSKPPVEHRISVGLPNVSKIITAQHCDGTKTAIQTIDAAATTPRPQTSLFSEEQAPTTARQKPAKV